MLPHNSVRKNFRLKLTQPTCSLQIHSRQEGVSLLVNGLAFALTTAEAIEIANTLVDAAES